ncbi:MAG: DUF2264 domain-containing protein [Verrucomicrobia bacterium]|nr:DUF2264 domain-containing protein [Verrucomicrobiota bacterium]
MPRPLLDRRGFMEISLATLGAAGLDAATGWAQPGAAAARDGAFGPFRNPMSNRSLSPHTGMDRASWLACGRHILEGAFSHVKGMDDPMFLPKMPGPGYPENNETAPRQLRSAAIFEAIARTFNVAAPLLKEDPELSINGIRLIDYYKLHLLRLVTDERCDCFIGRAADYRSQVQQTCELGNLAMWCLLAPEAFWCRLTQTERDRMAAAIGQWAVGHTLPHNWRWFNVMMLTLLDLTGYPADKEAMRNHLEHLILLHAGDGWYRDTGYDYYTAHVFQLYGAIWNSRYGNHHLPTHAAALDRQFAAFIRHYPQIFSREGHVIMMGRSALYRLGASAGMAAAQFRRDSDPSLTPGLARRVASAALLQFVTHPDFFQQGVPALGFYGPFPAVIQGYSCSASPYWMFLGFTCLTLPEDHPFWTSREEMGGWGDIPSGDARTEFWPGPGFLVTNHGPSGATDVRPGKIHDRDPNYSRLVYNSAFPWAADGPVAIANTMTLLDETGEPTLPDHISLAGFRDGVFYRQGVFAGHLPPSVDMATIPIPGGEIRVDRLRRLRPATFRLGHFSMPHIGDARPAIRRAEAAGKASLLIAIPGRQLALTIYQGWDLLETVTQHNNHPEATACTVIHVTRTDPPQPACPVVLCISILLHRTDDKPWTPDELQPIESVEPLAPDGIPALCGIRIRLRGGKEVPVDFGDIDGSNSIW